MAKILVADDNSNVQKTVALALVGLGVDVISVSNGEAAVRKLSEFTPDLVLADIFMPVRNGYEVCEFVKKDSRFKQIPVVLLVGAFDPLDEREAQRVGADGILKKPFVPPDPLIAMIKTLLDRTLGERLVAVSATKPVVAVASRSEAGGLADAPLPTPQAPEELEEMEPLRPVTSAAFDEGERPVAFGQLLDSPEQGSSASASALIEPVDNEQILTNTRDATLGDPIFWRNDSPEPEPGSESEISEQDDSESLDMHNWTPPGDTLSRHEDAAPLQPIEPLELVREGDDESSPSVVESGSILLDQASQAALTVEPGKAEELAANPIEWMATAPPPPPLHTEEPIEPKPGWDEEIPAAHSPIELDEVALPEPQSISPIVPEPVTANAVIPEPAALPIPAALSVPAVLPVSTALPASSLASEKVADKTPDPGKTHPSLPSVAEIVAPPSVAKQKVEDTARSIPKHDWEDLAAMLHTAAGGPAPDKAARDSSAEPAAVAPPAKPVAPARVTAPGEAVTVVQHVGSALTAPPVAPIQPATPVAAVPAAPPAAHMPATPPPSEPVAPRFSQPAISIPAKPASPDPALVEAVVQKVLDKMRPQVVEIITKEFLRPIVEALVHREIKKQ